MKKQLLIFFILLNYTINTVFAQTTGRESLSTSTEKNYKWGVGVQVSSPEEFTAPYSFLLSNVVNEKDNSAFSLGLSGNYFLRDNVFIRFRASMCNKAITYHEENKDTLVGPPYVRDETDKQNSKSITLGIGRSIEQKFIRIYAGFEIAATFFDKYSLNYHGTETTFGGYVETRSVIIPGGYALGLGAFTGCQFVFLKRFTVGPEFFCALQYYKVGGEDTYNNVIAGNMNYSYSSHTLITEKKIQFSKIKAAISLAYSF